MRTKRNSLLSSLANRRRTFIFLGLATLSIFLSAGPVFGNTIWTVLNTNDSGMGSLRQAIASASNGDVIQFAVSGQIVVATPLTFGPSVTVTGPGVGSLSISGGNSVGVFIINAGASVEMSGLQVTGGSSLLGGCIFNAGTLTLDSVDVSNCLGGNQLGGGIFNSGTLTLNNSNVVGNEAGHNGSPGEVGQGGGIYSFSGTVTLTNSDVSGNVVWSGGGITNGNGAGIYVNSGTLTMNGSTIENNTGGQGGGIFSSGTVNLNNSHVDGNTVGLDGLNGAPDVPGFGGGIYNNSGTLTLTNSDVSNNRALGENAGNTDLGTSSGGGIYVNSGALVVNGSTINNNFAGQGGGILNLGTTLTITNSTISGNGSLLGGNGIFTANTTTITDSTISSNETIASLNADGGPSDTLGGGITTGGTLTITNSTIWGNTVVGTGKNSGGIGGSGTVDLAFVTIANNTGGIFLFPPSLGGSTVLTIKASILASNQTNGTDILNCFISQLDASAVSEGFNISDDASCAGFFTQTGDRNSTAPGLSPSGLANNGGTTETVALAAGSPAINAIPVIDCTDTNGNAVTTDQRGVRRPQGGACDIGAFEYFHSLFPIPAVNTNHLISQVQSLDLPPGDQLALVIPLEGALDLMNAGAARPSIGLTDVFIGLVGLEQRTAVITAQQASPLVTSAQQIIQELSGSQ